MDAIVYAKAQQKDIVGIQQVARESWHATYAGIFTAQFIDDFLNDAYSTVSLARALENEQAHFGVAKAGEQVIGYAQGGPGRSGAVLYRIYVLPAYWRQGIGVGLLDRLDDWFRENGVPGYFCYVHRQNAVGKTFYQKRGFVHQADKDQDDEWCLWKNLA